jgi:hypothetical protein
MLFSCGFAFLAAGQAIKRDRSATEAQSVLSALLLPVLRERFPGRGLVEGTPPAPCVHFPGTHLGIRGVSIYDDGDELTVYIDDLTHGHFAEYDNTLTEAEREHRIVEAVVKFLSALFADRVAVWGQANVGGGWYHIDRDSSFVQPGTQEYVWSGPRT